MRIVSIGGPHARLAFAVVLVLGATAYAQVVPPATQPPPPPATPQQPAPTGAAPGAPAPVVPAPVVPVALVAARAFTAPTGMILNAVRPERVVDFEMVIGYLQAALAKSTNPQVQAQAQGWRMFKATEPGPNGTVLYVFLFDPAVVGADYALGPILSDAFPDQIEQIWKLYQGALAGPGSQSLLNLTPVQPPPLPPAGTPLSPTSPLSPPPLPPAGTPRSPTTPFSSP